MIFACDVCGREKETKTIQTGGGVLHICNWCINSNKLCPLGCKHKDIKCIDCIDMNKFERIN